jgi:hypothetical protein
MNDVVKLALYSNASTLGIHWIYNQSYLKKLSEKQSLFFTKQTKVIYDASAPSYFAYPDANIGDVTIQGMALAWLYQALKSNPQLTVDEYKTLLLSKTLPGGTYIGYVESYLRQLIVNHEIESMKLPLTPLVINDDHLIGFVPYIACKQLGLPTSKAIELASLFTQKEEYWDLFKMFDFIFDRIEKEPIKELLKKAILLGPKKYQIQLNKALSMDDTFAFVKDYAGTACAINQSVPIMIHLLNKVTSFKDMLLQNALISGSISERGMLLAALVGQIYPVNDVIDDKLSLHLMSILVG